MQRIIKVLFVFVVHSCFLFPMQSDRNEKFTALITVVKQMFEANDELSDYTLDRVDRRERRQLKRETSVGKDNYCHICKHTYANDHYYLNHMAVHEGTSEYICDYCQKHFTQSCNLQRHLNCCKQKPKNKKELL